ncbi:uncharacterized protein RJT21DRAFT_698 [Scheffersomyces amazonensis]|uniref:uncharacterized protein n=1 Tax=Scheffersomyces amazonensis TaxID=1078765 RepID=UPI00315CB842
MIHGDLQIDQEAFFVIDDSTEQGTKAEHNFELDTFNNYGHMQVLGAQTHNNMNVKLMPFRFSNLGTMAFYNRLDLNNDDGSVTFENPYGNYPDLEYDNSGTICFQNINKVLQEVRFGGQGCVRIGKNTNYFASSIYRTHTYYLESDAYLYFNNDEHGIQQAVYGLKPDNELRFNYVGSKFNWGYHGNTLYFYDNNGYESIFEVGLLEKEGFEFTLTGNNCPDPNNGGVTVDKEQPSISKRYINDCVVSVKYTREPLYDQTPPACKPCPEPREFDANFYDIVLKNQREREFHEYYEEWNEEDNGQWVTRSGIVYVTDDEGGKLTTSTSTFPHFTEYTTTFTTTEDDGSFVTESGVVLISTDPNGEQYTTTSIIPPPYTEYTTTFTTTEDDGSVVTESGVVLVTTNSDRDLYTTTSIIPPPYTEYTTTFTTTEDDGSVVTESGVVLVTTNSDRDLYTTTSIIPPPYTEYTTTFTTTEDDGSVVTESGVVLVTTNSDRDLYTTTSIIPPPYTEYTTTFTTTEDDGSVVTESGVVLVTTNSDRDLYTTTSMFERPTSSYMSSFGDGISSSEAAPEDSTSSMLTSQVVSTTDVIQEISSEEVSSSSTYSSFVTSVETSIEYDPETSVEYDPATSVEDDSETSSSHLTERTTSLVSDYPEASSFSSLSSGYLWQNSSAPAYSTVVEPSDSDVPLTTGTPLQSTQIVSSSTVNFPTTTITSHPPHLTTSTTTEVYSEWTITTVIIVTNPDGTVQTKTAVIIDPTDSDGNWYTITSWLEDAEETSSSELHSDWSYTTTIVITEPDGSVETKTAIVVDPQNSEGDWYTYTSFLDDTETTTESTETTLVQQPSTIHMESDLVSSELHSDWSYTTTIVITEPDGSVETKTAIVVDPQNSEGDWYTYTSFLDDNEATTEPNTGATEVYDHPTSTITTTWSGTFVTTMTFPGDDIDTVIIATPVDTVTITQTWTGSEPTTSTIKGQFTDTIVVSIPSNVGEDNQSNEDEDNTTNETFVVTEYITTYISELGDGSMTTASANVVVSSNDEGQLFTSSSVLPFVTTYTTTVVVTLEGQQATTDVYEVVISSDNQGTASTNTRPVADVIATDGATPEYEGSNQGNTDQGNTDQGNTDQGNTDQGNTDQGNTVQGNTDQGNTNQGNTNESSGNQATEQSSNDEGNFNQGTPVELGVANEVNANQDISNGNIANQGAEGQGSLNQGLENEVDEEIIYQGNTNQGESSGDATGIAPDNVVGNEGVVADEVIANGEGANVEANVEGANVEGANVEGANVEGANFEANVEGANVEGANVEGANVEGANVEGANVEGANVEGANGLANGEADVESNVVSNVEANGEGSNGVANGESSTGGIEDEVVIVPENEHLDGSLTTMNGESVAPTSIDYFATIATVNPESHNDHEGSHRAPPVEDFVIGSTHEVEEFVNKASSMEYPMISWSMKQVEFRIPEDNRAAVEGLKGVYNRVLNEEATYCVKVLVI